MATRRKTTTDALGRKVPTSRRSWGMIELLPSGRYRARYVGDDGLKHAAPRTFDTKTDAEGWLAGERHRLDSGEWTPESVTAPRKLQADRTQPFRDYATEWVRTRLTASGEPLRTRTREEYLRMLATVLEPLAAVPIGSLKTSVVDEWYRSVIQSGRKTTASRAYGFARAVMATAVEAGLVKSNPIVVRGAANARTGRKVVPPTAVELDLIVEKMPDRLKVATLIAAWGSLRFGELTELRRRDLVRDDDLYRIRVERAVTHTSAGYVVGKPKSAAGERDVLLPPWMTPLIEAHLEQHTEPGDDGLLFPSKSGGRGAHMGQPELLRSGWDAARNAAGRPDLPWHGLRHFGGTEYAVQGATLRELQARLGHSTVAAAMTYQHAATDRARELTRRLGTAPAN